MMILLGKQLTVTVTKHRSQKVKTDFCEKVCLCDYLRSKFILEL